VPVPDPAADEAAAAAKLAVLQSADDERVRPITGSQLFAPEGPARATIVFWHGFTNAPSQFVAVAEAFAAQGYRVLLPRMPHHGYTDLLNRELAHLTTDELTAQATTAVDIAAGFGDPVWVVGLSAGALLAGWAALTRPEVRRLVLAAPLVAPKGFPLPLVRLCVRFPRVVPRFYMWWDPRVKAELGHSPYAYPGFPVTGIMPFLHLSELMFDHSVAAGHDLDRVVLVSNPGDFAIRRDAARSFAVDVFAAHARYYGEAGVDGGLKWMHDFVDPFSPDSGSTDQVVAIFSAALGAGQRPVGS
jgi:carboxylesterase